ncbi:hypothetical protein HDV03_003694 [Kappamyces sp. JEL0829]|nr:hypothetical protein HDV03_003694 [Kappamyces sp. JEL0829]
MTPMDAVFLVLLLAVALYSLHDIIRRRNTMGTAIIVMSSLQIAFSVVCSAVYDLRWRVILDSLTLCMLYLIVLLDLYLQRIFVLVERRIKRDSRRLFFALTTVFVFCCGLTFFDCIVKYLAPLLYTKTLSDVDSYLASIWIVTAILFDNYNGYYLRELVLRIKTIGKTEISEMSSKRLVRLVYQNWGLILLDWTGVFSGVMYIYILPDDSDYRIFFTRLGYLCLSCHVAGMTYIIENMNAILIQDESQASDQMKREKHTPTNDSEFGLPEPRDPVPLQAVEEMEEQCSHHTE